MTLLGQPVVDTGFSPDDGTGEPVREAFEASNAAFAALASPLEGVQGEIADLQILAGAKPSVADVALAVAVGLSALRTSLLNGADAAHDTFGEIQVLLQANDGVLAAIMQAIGARLIATSNLAELTDKVAARSNLGLGDAATMSQADLIRAVRNALNGQDYSA